MAKATPTENRYPKPGEKLEDHPISQLFPMMELDERAQLVASIRKHGQKEDIVLLDGQILDGRNRYEACREIGQEPTYRFYDYRKDGQSPIDFVMVHNLHRRNLTTSQKSAIAVGFVEMFKEEADTRKEKTLIHNQTISIKPFDPADENQEREEVTTTTTTKRAPAKTATAAAAEVMGVSERSVAAAAAVKKEDPKAFEQIKDGEVTVNAAAVKLEKRQQAEAELDKAMLRIRSVLGDSLYQAIKEGTRVKGRKEILALAALSNEDMTRIRGHIEDGWPVKKAVAYKIKALGRTHSIGDLVNRAAAQNGMFSLSIDSWMITVQRIK